MVVYTISKVTKSIGRGFERGRKQVIVVQPVLTILMEFIFGCKSVFLIVALETTGFTTLVHVLRAR
jgi:hypothetical protein